MKYKYDFYNCITMPENKPITSAMNENWIRFKTCENVVTAVAYVTVSITSQSNDWKSST